MKKIRIIFYIVVSSFICPSYANNENNLEILPAISLEYIQAHPMYSVLRVRTTDSIILKTPPVQNQGMLNSCVGWALGYTAASIRLFAESSATNFDTVYWCSPSYLFNQYKDPEGTTDCSSVSARIQNLGYYLMKEGICSYQKMPYTTDCTTMPNTGQRINAMNKRFSINNAPSTNNSNILKTILDYGWPIVVGMPLYDSFEDMWYDSTAHGIWTSVDTAVYSSGLGHASCVVGYDDTKEAFKVMNSWGTSGGDNGYYWVKYSVVEQGAFRDAVLVSLRDSAQIEGPEILTDTTAWYHLRNVPAGATITWSITNISPLSSKTFVRASAQGRDSVRIAYRDLSINPGGPKAGDTPAEPLITRYQYADLTVTVSSGSNSYSTTKRIGKQITIAPHPFFLRSNTANDNMIVNTNDEHLHNAGNYTIELWHSMYGLMRTHEIQNTNEPIETVGLPQGVYIILYKDQNGAIIDQKKIMVNN